jgi:hypothetical protein
MEFAFSFLVRLFHPLQHAGLSRRTPRRDSNGRTNGSIKEDVKRKSFSASWKPRKVSASSPLPLCGCLEAYRAYVGEMFRCRGHRFPNLPFPLIR